MYEALRRLTGTTVRSLSRMSRATPIPSNAELEILRILWKEGPTTDRAIHDELRGKCVIAYTTLIKTVQVMAETMLVTLNESAPSHVYSTAVPEASVK